MQRANICAQGTGWSPAVEAARCGSGRRVRLRKLARAPARPWRRALAWILATMRKQSPIVLKTDILIELLFGVVILGGSGWLLTQVYEIKSSMSSMERTIYNTSERVDKIAEVLPDIRVKVASEELMLPYSMALITTKPVTVTHETRIVRVYLLDTEHNKKETYSITFSDPDSLSFNYRLSGKVLTSNSKPISFRELKTMSYDVGQPVSLPLYVDDRFSFILRKNDPELRVWLSQNANKESTVHIENISDWYELTADLNENSDEYR